MSTAPGALGKPAGEGAMGTALDTTLMGSIIVLALETYATHSRTQQAEVKALLQELVSKAIAGVDPSTRMPLDSQDGAAICFLDDPAEALRTALLVRDLVAQRGRQSLSLRVALHLGPVSVQINSHNQLTAEGDGVDAARRMMDFSAHNQITLSRAFYEAIARISQGAGALFEYLGTHLDQNQRLHEVYALSHGDTTAHSLLRQQATRQPAQTLRHKVAIQDVAIREALANPNDARAPRAAPVGVSKGSLTTSPASSIAPLPSPGPSVANGAQAQWLSPALQAALEHEMALHIGPLARTLVRKELTHAAGLDALLNALASHIDQADAQAQFVTAARRIANPKAV